MKNSCVMLPSKGISQFNSLKKLFGYTKAVDIFLTAINPKFIQDYKDTLILDDMGVPTLSSILNNEYIQGLINSEELSKMLSLNYNKLEDTIDNFETILNQAYEFNNNLKHNDKFVAIVQRNDDNTIQVSIKPKTQEYVDNFNNDYSTFKLNQRIELILKPVGITIGTLYEYESDAGRLGVTDFVKAKGIALDFSSIIRVANNVSGALLISEEFSHLMIGVFRNENFILRSLNYLKQNEDLLRYILEDEYEDTVKFFNGNMDLVAEEVLGQILQDNLINYNSDNETILDRTMNFIRNKFEGFDHLDIERAIIYADAEMKLFAKNILNKNLELTEELIENSYRKQQFNSLDKRIKRNIDILLNSINTEIQRYTMLQDKDKKKDIKERINLLTELKDNEHVLEGICRYAQLALTDLEILNKRLNSLKNFNNTELLINYKFSVLRDVRRYTQSYQRFIKDINSAIAEDDLEYESLNETEKELDLFEWIRNGITVFDKDGNPQTIDMKQIIQELNQMSIDLNNKFNKIGTPLFCEYLKPFLPEGFVDKNGDKITVLNLMESANDISWFDKWLDPMGDSASLLLLLIDARVKLSNTDARLETINNIRRILALMQAFEKEGINEFSWMFEVDREGNKSGNYITATNHAEYNLDKKIKLQELHDKYGEQPKGEDAKKFKQELKEWRKTHCINEFVDIPNPEVYRNLAFFDLKANKTKYDLYLSYIGIKESLDKRLGMEVDPFLAILKRKDGVLRLADSTRSIEELWENVKLLEQERWKDSEDDDLIFGLTSKKAIVDFDGKEFLRLPALYVAKLKNPNEITEDVFSALMSYAYTSCMFEQMDKIIDGLEVGRTLINDSDNFRVNDTRGGKQVMQKIRYMGNTYKLNALKLESNLVLKLNDYYESHVYMRYIKDLGVTPILGLNVNKAVSRLLEYSSLALLGFNFLANVANVATGKSMQRIEAVSGEFFDYKELLRADKEYYSQLPNFLSESGNRVKSNKLYLFDLLFDVKQTFDKTVKQPQYKSVIKRLFGDSFAFFGQEAGDHWLYNRTAIAMAIRQKVLKDGKEMSLWDALEVKSNKYNIPYLNITEIKNLDGSDFSINDFQRMVANVNQGLFGVYNTEDSNAANRVALGRLLQQYRKWIKPLMNKRFMAKLYNIALQREQEGYYRTFFRLIIEGVRGKILVGEWFKDLSDMEKYNLRRVITEMTQFIALALLIKLIDWPDDKDRSWALKMAEYIAKRELHELGGLAPSPIMILEQLKNIKTPMPSLSAILNLINLGISLVSPEDYLDEIQSGPYKGYSTLHKNFSKAPLPIFAQYHMIDKFMHELDNSINYYARPY